MKLCKKCNETKPLSQFHRRGEGTQANCKPCAIAARVDYYKRHREKEGTRNAAWARKEAAWMRDLKADTPCTDCNQHFHPAAMHWDHLPGHEKSFNIGQARGLSRARIQKELEKCELVCANCHAVRTATRLEQTMGSRVVLASL